MNAMNTFHNNNNNNNKNNTSINNEYGLYLAMPLNIHPEALVHSKA